MSAKTKISRVTYYRFITHTENRVKTGPPWIKSRPVNNAFRVFQVRFAKQRTHLKYTVAIEGRSSISTANRRGPRKENGVSLEKNRVSGRFEPNIPLAISGASAIMEYPPKIKQWMQPVPQKTYEPLARQSLWLLDDYARTHRHRLSKWISYVGFNSPFLWI